MAQSDVKVTPHSDIGDASVKVIILVNFRFKRNISFGMITPKLDLGIYEKKNRWFLRR